MTTTGQILSTKLEIKKQNKIEPVTNEKLIRFITDKFKDRIPGEDKIKVEVKELK